MATVMETDIEVTNDSSNEVTVTLRGSGAKIFNILIGGMSVEELTHLSEAIGAELARGRGEA